MSRWPAADRAPGGNAERAFPTKRALGRTALLPAVLILCFSVCLRGSDAWPGQRDLAVAQVGLGSHVARVELALTMTQWVDGLSHRQSLAPDSGMLFVFPQSEVISFTMRDTHFPLSIAFLNADAVITEIRALSRNGTQRVSSTLPSHFALEMNLGWFDRHGAGPGDSLRLISVGGQSVGFAANSPGLVLKHLTSL